MVNPVMLLVKEPIPDPSVVFVLNEITGLGLVPHTMPLVVTIAPPSEVILPPLLAVVLVIELADVVVNSGNKFPFRPLNAGKLICANPSKESSVKNNI